jgi:Arm DNA-binding domain
VPRTNKAAQTLPWEVGNGESPDHKAPSRWGLNPTTSDFTVFDTDLVGFGVRVRSTGGMSYIVQYKAGTGRGAPTRRVTLGGVGKMTPEQARKAAEKVLGSVAHGEDPAADKTRGRRGLPISDVIRLFLRITWKRSVRHRVQPLIATCWNRS